MRGSWRFSQKKSNIDNVFLWGKGQDSNVGSPVKMACRGRADDGPTLNSGSATLWLFRGSGPVLLIDPNFLWYFEGGGPDPLPPSGSAYWYLFENTRYRRDIRPKLLYFNCIIAVMWEPVFLCVLYLILAVPCIGLRLWHILIITSYHMLTYLILFSDNHIFIFVPLTVSLMSNKSYKKCSFLRWYGA